MFDHCLAPDTSGDGCGCDNMTGIIVQLNPRTKASKENVLKHERLQRVLELTHGGIHVIQVYTHFMYEWSYGGSSIIKMLKYNNLRTKCGV